MEAGASYATADPFVPGFVTVRVWDNNTQSRRKNARNRIENRKEDRSSILR
jgi:hypothetical protein